ncbi:MAG: hypothetical protein ACK4TI_03465 [Nitrososphaerales archaeon]
MWSDPVYKKAIEEYIKAWLEYRRKSVWSKPIPGSFDVSQLF